MLYFSTIFFFIALVAGLFGFWGLAGASSGIAQVLFFFFLVAFVVTLVMNAFQGRRPPL
jgi:uncharacterized membrane protein YtjA (UPF0391 family)